MSEPTPLSILLAVALCACGGRDGRPGADAATADGATTDSGTSFDAGRVDGGAQDAAASDAGLADASSADSGSMCPAGCTAPENATATCPEGTCDFSCDAGWVRRGDACVETLACTPGLIGAATRITDDGNANNTPTVAVSGDVAAVFWIRGGIGSSTRSVYARFYDYPAFTPRTDAQVVASAALDETSRIEVVPVTSGFAVLYDREDGISGDSRCALDLFDADGVRSPGEFTATGGDCRWPGFSGSDAGFAMVWSRAPVNARRFGPDGRRVAGTSTTVISTAGGGVNGEPNRIAWHTDRGDYRIAYVLADSAAATFGVRTATLSTTGFVTSTDVVAASGFDSTDGTEIVAAGSGYGLLFTARLLATDTLDKYLVALDADGNPVASPRPLGRVTRDTLAGGPHEIAVALGQAGDIEVRMFDLAGAPLGVSIDVASGPSDSDWPDIAWAGDSFVVAWTDDVAGAGLDDIYVARVCPTR